MLLWENKCICQEGYFLNIVNKQEKECLKCTGQNCSRCDSVKPEICNLCNYEYYLADGECFEPVNIKFENFKGGKGNFKFLYLK